MLKNVSNFPGVNELVALPGISGYIWLLFLFTAALLTFWATKMVRNADVLIFKTKFGGAFVGSVLISIINASPELIAAVTQSAFGSPEVGLADTIGANAIASVLIFLSAILLYKDLFLTKIKGIVRIVIVIALVANLLYGIFILLGVDIPGGSIGIIPAIFFLIYLCTIFIQYKFGEKTEHSIGLSPKLEQISVKKAILFFLIYSLLLFATAFLLNYLIQGFQLTYNIPSESAGGIFLAISTALPEIVSYIYFVRQKKPLLGLGTLIWASIFNTSLLFWSDVAFLDGPVITVPEIADARVWGISFMVSILLLFILLPSLFSQFFQKHKIFYYINISIGTLTFFVGWALILGIPHHSPEINSTIKEAAKQLESQIILYSHKFIF